MSKEPGLTGSEIDTASTGRSASSLEARGEIERLLGKDLLGPWLDDEHETLPVGATPSDRYILGVLSPRGSTLPAETTDASATDDGGAEGAGEVAAAAAAGSMSLASLGLSFRVAEEETQVRAIASWGRYEQITVEEETADGTVPRRVWTRVPETGSVLLDLTQEAPEGVPVASLPGVVVRGRVRHVGACRFVDVALVNAQPEPDERRDNAKLFQARLAISAANEDRAVFLPHHDYTHAVAGDSVDVAVDDEATLTSDPEVAGLSMLYRRSLQFAVGRNCAVNVSRRFGEECAWGLTTTSLPVYDVPQTVAPRPETQPLLEGLRLDMRWLSSARRDEVIAAVRPLATGYREWLKTRAKRIGGDGTLEPHKSAADRHLAAATKIADRIDHGVDLLAERSTSGDQAWEAWCFTNAVMADQRQRTEVADLRKSADEPLADLLAATDDSDKRSWRPFQLAFVLLNIPSLVNPAHPERSLAGSADGDGLVDLLFFPTGGGKTEAYLGLTAFTLAIRRLQGVVGEGPAARDGRAGVAVLMRYTLRLLTAQQFQRAAALICACEATRRQAAAAAASDGARNPWGDEPFRIGLWVGARVTPNWYEQAAEAVANAHDRMSSSGMGNPVQLLSCPWCARPLSAKDATCDDERRRVLVYCSDPDGACDFGRRRSAGWDEGLPVVTIDEEIFRLAPSLVIGTVDKFAQLPLNGQTALLFGRARTRCARHGYRHEDLADKIGCKSSHPRSKSGLPAVKPEKCTTLRPPDLVIQDELHLISGALGTLVGLYETVVDQLATWAVDGKNVRPKVVASTATVRRAETQVHGLFARRTAVFPPPLFDAGETFFSTQIAADDDHPGRRYVGVCAHGVRLKQVQIRVAQILLGAAMDQFDRFGVAADPYMTLVNYFSSTVELAGMRRMVEDDIEKRVQRLTRRGLSNRPIPLNLAELTSRINHSDISATLKATRYAFQPDLDSTAARQQVRQWTKAAKTGKGREATAARQALETHNAKRPMSERPIDVLLATSMLQVGVDVARLGLMVVTGQPKNSAEYIQASSRVGRDPQRPGLVTVIYNWARPRDLAHFETFGHYHETAYAKVEALSVTPFADRALDRGLAAVLVAMIRHSRPEFEPETGAHLVPDHLDEDGIVQAIERIAARAEYVTAEPAAGGRVRQHAAHLLDVWSRRRHGLETGGLTYTRRGDISHPLLESSPTAWDEFSVGWSLREVEPEVNLLLRAAAPELEDRPGWTYGPPKVAHAGDTELAEEDVTDADDDLPPISAGGYDELGIVAIAASTQRPQGEIDA